MAPPALQPRGSRIHRAWIVAAVTMGALVAGSSFRSSTGVLLEPLEHEFGWARAATSGAVTANLVLYGLTAPFAAAIMERWGIRRVISGALLLVGLGSALTTVMTSIWQLWLLWGVAIGVGTGSMALVFGAIVANRWFATHRGLVTGVFSAANAAGQLVFLPLIAAAATGPGWRYAAGTVAVLALLLVPAVWLILRDHPEDVGTTPYGAPTTAPRPGLDDLPPSSVLPDDDHRRPTAPPPGPTHGAELVEVDEDPLGVVLDVPAPPVTSAPRTLPGSRCGCYVRSSAAGLFRRWR